MPELISLIEEVRACTLCSEHLEHGVRPVVQLHEKARILIVGQAPGRKVHESGVPFDDASGDRLRDWLGIDKATFYDETQIAILPMGFCYPGSHKGKGKSGDLAPRPECAKAWRKALLSKLERIELTLVIGQYAQAYHLGKRLNVTETVKAWQDYWPDCVPLPHPSPRNNIWMAKNPWFSENLLPKLKLEVARILSS
ncbi:MAG: uracil-DNA glycosylase family protein [Marinomonas sp.]